MTTMIRFLEPLADVVTRRTGVEFVSAADTTLYGENSGVIVRRSGGMAIVFDPADEQFCVGVISGDVWLAKGHDLETMMRDPELVEILAGRKCPFSAWKDASAPAPKPKKTRFTISLLGVEVVVRW